MARIRTRKERTEEDRAWMRAVEKALLEGAALDDLPDRPRQPRSAAADPARLRGLPAIGPGVTGAIPGTAPHFQQQLEKWGGR